VIDEIESDPRIAGQITRYHTWPRLRDQSVGEHSWQITRILLTVWPACPRRMLVHATLHDVGEMAGDIPYPGKRNDPVLKDRMDAAERAVHYRMTERWRLPSPAILSHYEEKVFKCIEYIEMWEYGLQEQNLGNKYGAVVSLRMIVAANALIDALVPTRGDPDIRPSIRKYVDERKRQEWGAEGVPPRLRAEQAIEKQQEEQSNG
jgi:5'-deoxynucleotidase YfbR-like HD superfamily hydrolase